ncbi:MAG: hypothetical protein CMC03_02975 [Flavobacteriaceae bacterium]|nr:hypothetical protein [Flavobacteriaceae bacterium]
MIQRIQTLLILILSLLSLTTFYFSYEVQSKSIVNNIFLFVAIVSFINIFLFHYRLVQARICLMLYFVFISIITYYFIYLINGIKLEPTYFHISSSFIQLVLAFFARKAILKDEDLIRSVDRIR